MPRPLRPFQKQSFLVDLEDLSLLQYQFRQRYQALQIGLYYLLARWNLFHLLHQEDLFPLLRQWVQEVQRHQCFPCHQLSQLLQLLPFSQLFPQARKVP